jgi:hypothetical protein
LADPVTASSINPFANINLGVSMGTMGSIALVIAIAVVVLVLIGGLIYWRQIKKAYWINIHVFRLIGNIPTRVAIYTAREIPFGMAGDKLWKVAPSGLIKLKTLKWLPVGKIQTAPREWWYYIRDDGEWVNFQMSDLNEISRNMGIKFVQEDMRLQRLATERLLEQRLMNKTFWEKWGTTVMLIIVFLVVAICMVVIFYQFSKIIDQFNEVTRTQLETSKILLRVFGENYITETMNQTSGATTGLVPV